MFICTHLGYFIDQVTTIKHVFVHTPQIMKLKYKTCRFFLLLMYTDGK